MWVPTEPTSGTTQRPTLEMAASKMPESGRKAGNEMGSISDVCRRSTRRWKERAWRVPPAPAGHCRTTCGYSNQCNRYRRTRGVRVGPPAGSLTAVFAVNGRARSAKAGTGRVNLASRSPNVTAHRYRGCLRRSRSCREPSQGASEGASSSGNESRMDYGTQSVSQRSQ